MMMLKVPVLIISALVLILVVATIFKQYQRKILWSAAIVLFVGTLLLVGIGVIDPVGETHPNLPALTGIIMALVGAAALAINIDPEFKTTMPNFWIEQQGMVENELF